MPTIPNQNNLIDITFVPADGISAVGFINQAEQLFPFLLGLSADDKKRMQGINVSNKNFVESCIAEMEGDASILPPFISLAEIKNDLSVYSGLEPVVRRAEDLAAKLGSTQYVAGAEAYFKCLLYYNLLAMAARNGMPGAQEKYNRLKERFESQGRPGSQDDAASANDGGEIDNTGN